MTFWSLTNSDFPTNQTFHQFHDLDTELDLHRLWVVSMEHLQRVWHASRERLPFRTPGSVPILGLANAPIVETKFLELAMFLLDFSPRIPLGTFSILLIQIRRSYLNREILFIICVSFGKLSPESWPESLVNVGLWPGRYSTVESFTSNYDRVCFSWECVLIIV